MEFNLLNEQWIPVRRRSGTRSHIAPWQITEDSDDPIVNLDLSRPDFSASMIQFLIGLYQSTMAPVKERDWFNFFNTAPSSDEILDKMKKFESAFNLDGSGHRFMQDSSVEDENRKSIAALLIDSPGGKTEKDGKAFFVKSGRIVALCPACAAKALFTMQTNAPAGGVGYRTSLRGGGPLTTILIDDSFWKTIALNVLSQERFADRSERIFPWMEEVRTSRKGDAEITPDDVPALQMYWAMPRRIWLHFESNSTDTECSICGEIDDSMVSEYSEVNYGPNYAGGLWEHPLTPYYSNNDAPYNPLHGSTGCTLYRHWLGYINSDSEGSRQPAPVARLFVEERGRRLQDEMQDESRIRLRTFGYDMDNMKARCWYDGSMPVHVLPEELRSGFIARVEGMTEAAVMVSSNTVNAVKKGLFGSIDSITKSKWAKWEIPRFVKNDRDLLQAVNDAFWQDTEGAFYRNLVELRSLLLSEQDTEELMRAWLKTLQQASFSLFSIQVESGDMRSADPKILAQARTELAWGNNGKKLYETLNLPTNSKKENNNEEDA